MTEFFAYLLIIVLISVLGGLLPLYRRRWSDKGLSLLLGFGGGVLLGASFFYMWPEVTNEIGGRMGGVSVLLGFLLMLLLEKFILVHPCEETEFECDFHTVGIAAFIGISFHSLLDGIAFGSSSTLPYLGSIVFTALLFHKVPEGISLASILLMGGYGRRRIVYLILVSALMTPIGALLSFFGLKALNGKAIAIAFAIGVSAGVFLAIATSDLLPQAHRNSNHRLATLSCVLLGVLVIIFSGILRIG